MKLMVQVQPEISAAGWPSGSKVSPQGEGDFSQIDNVPVTVSGTPVFAECLDTIAQ